MKGKPALQLLRKWWKPVLQEFVKGVAKGLGLYFIAHLLTSWDEGPGRALGPSFLLKTNVVGKRENVTKSLNARCMAWHLIENQIKLGSSYVSRAAAGVR
jgi:hypothetical protein